MNLSREKAEMVQHLIVNYRILKFSMEWPVFGPHMKTAPGKSAGCFF